MSPLYLFLALILATFANIHLLAQQDSSPGSTPESAPLVPTANEASTSHSLIPYRRVYLPADLLQKSIGDRDYSPSEWSQSADLLKTFETDAETAALYHRPPELESVFYTASLVGMNLVSEYSRIQINRGSFIGERLSLFPWSFHLVPSIETNNSTDSQNNSPFSRFAFDRLGRPSVSLHRSDTKLAREKLNVPFGWTLASEKSNSQQQSFRASIPACPNSLLLLALPQSAWVQDANVPVIEIVRWADLQSRLGDWDSEAKQAMDRVAANSPNLTFWLLELGGVQSLNLTISSRATDTSSLVLENANRFDELILSQKIDHQISSHCIKSKCTLDIPWDAVKSTDVDLRIKLEKGSRLSRVASLNRELDWRIDNGWLLLRKNSLFSSPVQRESSVQVDLELLTEALVSDETNDYNSHLPSFSLGHGYVLKGSTSIEVAKDVELTKITTSNNGRLLESTTSRGMTFEWWVTPLGIEIGFEGKRQPTLSKLLYRITGQEDSLAIKARALFSRALDSDLILELDPGWTLLEAVQPTTRRNIPFEILAGASASSEQIVLQKDDLQSIGLEIDFQIVPPSGQINKELIFPAKGWMRIGTGPHETLMIAENIGQKWDMPTVESDTWIGVENLAANEKAFISAPEKCFVWSVPKDTSYVFAKKDLVALLTIDIETKISRIGEDVIRIEHLFQEENPIASIRPKCELPALRWFSRKGGPLPGGEFQFSETGSKDPVSVLRFNLPFSEETKEESRWSIECEVRCGSEGVHVPVPAFPANVIVTHQLRVAPDIEVDTTPSGGRWICGKDGELVLELPKGNLSPNVKFRDTSIDLSSPLSHPVSKVDVAIDGNGKRYSKWTILFSSLASGKNTIGLNDGWNVDFETLRIQEGSGKSWTERGQEANEFHLHFLTSKNVTDEESSVVVVFDAIKNDTFLDAKSVASMFIAPFDFPSIQWDSRRLKSSGSLWIPAGQSWKVVSTMTPRSQPRWSLRTGAPWWSRSQGALLSDRSESTEDFTMFGPLSQPPGYWKKIATWAEKDSEDSVVIAIGSRFQWFGGLLFSLMFLVTLWTIPKRKWAVIFGALVLSTLAIFLSTLDPLMVLPLSMAIAGYALGAIVASIALVVFPSRKKRDDPSREESVVAWDLLRADAASRPIPSSAQPLAKVVLLFMLTLGGSSIANAQSELSTRQDVNFDFVFPTSDSNEPLASVVYVPDSFYSSIKGNSPSPYLLFSAKHQWRIASRTRTFAGLDQLTSTYEIWIGTGGVPMEFPVRSNLVRFSVNDLEIAYGARLQRNLSNNTIVWTPEKPGRYKVQVVVVPQLEFYDSDSLLADAPILTQLFDISILPAATALLEIDAYDPLVQVEVDALGGVTNPAPGKYVASLGNVDKIKGRLKFPNSGYVNPARNPSLAEPPTLCTEFLLSETIQARTVIQIPSGGTLDSPLEMEVDGNWQPIGRSWGSLQLVETRASNSYSRRRYVFIDTARGLVDKESASQLTILWGVRDPSTVALNAQFAECVDRRVRSSVLRYARMPDAAWSIDEVNTWPTLIGERERLDWPELIAINVNPRATSLRIPANGGRGILKKSSRQGNVQARISTRWMVSPQSQVMQSRVEVIGTLNGDYIELDLPEGFIVTEARRRQGSFVILQQHPRQNGQAINRVQLFMDRVQSDRLQWKDFDFSIRAEHVVVEPLKLTSPPTVSLANIKQVEQTIELSASERWKIDVVGQNESLRTIFGAGINSTLLTITPDQRMIFDRREFPATSAITHRFTSQPGTDKVLLNIGGVFDVRSNSSSKFLVEIPDWLEEYWSCDRSASLVPCPIAAKAWLQVDLGQPNAEQENRDWSIQFSLIQEELPLLKSDATLIRVLSSRLQPIPFSLEFTEVEIPGTSVESFRQKETTNSYVWVESRSQENEKSIVKYWLDAWSPSLEWKVDSRQKISMVRVQGSIVPWSWDNGLLSVSIPRQANGWLYEVTLELNDSEPGSIVPRFGNPPAITDKLKAMEIPEVREQAIVVIAETLRQKLESVSADTQDGSYANKWFTFWGTKMYQLRRYSDSFDERLQSRLVEVDNLLVNHNPDFVQIRESTPAIPTPRTSSVERKANPSLDWLYGFETGLFLLAAIAVYGRWASKPWWLLISVAALFWLMTGWISIPGILIGAATIAAIDTYWIRRNSKTISRSQRLRAS